VGAAFLIVRLIDIMLDPFMGGMMDRTRTRWGRFRPWLVGPHRS
jgi:GPH family glycoside/pentoside/hexuronide:cation symporter